MKKSAFLVLAAGLVSQGVGAGGSTPREEVEFCETEGTYAICYYADDGGLLGKSGECPKECAPWIEPLPPEEDENPPTHQE